MVEHPTADPEVRVSNPAIARHLGLYYKTLPTCKVRKLDRLSGKLVFLLLSVTFAGLDKHTRLLWNLLIVNPYCFIAQAPGENS